MRIIAGKYGGRILRSARDRSIRPTTDRVKQSLFDLLTHRISFEGIEVLDLFAGSGSLGLEALSRGAASVVFVESSHRSIAVLQRNITALGCDSACSIIQADVFWYLRTVRTQFDLVFADPPFDLEALGELPTAIGRARVTRPGGYAVMEHGRTTPVYVPEEYFTVTTKQFGQTTLLILQPRPGPVPSSAKAAT